VIPQRRAIDPLSSSPGIEPWELATTFGALATPRVAAIEDHARADALDQPVHRVVGRERAD
jgi:hypothetical protein